MPVRTTASITGLPIGSYTVTVTDANGCTKQSTVTITQPVAPLSVSVAAPGLGGSGTLTANPAGGTAPYTYLWSNGQTSKTATGLTLGVKYVVTVTDFKGCKVTSPQITAVRLEDAGVVSLSGYFDAIVYPNPTANDFTLLMNASQDDHYSIQLIDLSGRLIEHREGMATEGENRILFNDQNLSAGIYFVRIALREDELKVIRVVVQK